jgi:hypothetical protein
VAHFGALVPSKSGEAVGALRSLIFERMGEERTPPLSLPNGYSRPPRTRVNRGAGGPEGIPHRVGDGGGS